MKAIDADLATRTQQPARSSSRAVAHRPWGRADARSVQPPSAAPVRITGLALCDPAESFSQGDVLRLLGLSGDEFAERIYARCGVERRQLKLTGELLATTVQGRAARLEEELFGHAVEAVDELGVDPLEIGVVVSSTLYSLAGPTIAHRLVDHYGMDSATDKYHVMGVGCASAVPLMRLAGQTLRDHPGKKALVVAAESMSGILTSACESDERSKIVGSSIFGDGCAAALLEPGDDVLGPAIVASKVHQVGGTLDAVRMQVTPQDSYLHLARELPDLAAAGLDGLVDEFLAVSGLERDTIDHWLVHPGGRRIIESVQQALGLPREEVQVSYDVLAEHGNVGTPSIFYVLQRALQEREPRSGEHGLMVTVGPGVTVGLMLLRW